MKNSYYKELVKERQTLIERLRFLDRQIKDIDAAVPFSTGRHVGKYSKNKD